MKILFDHQLFSWQRYGGASKYFVMLLSRLPKEIWETTTVFSNNAYVESLNLFPHHNFLKKYFFGGQGRIMHIMNKPYTQYRLRKRDYDIYHQTHFDTFGLKDIGLKPMVTTFHDINYSSFSYDAKVLRWQRESLARADKIIAISHNTKKDIMELFGVDSSKISVIYHGIELYDTFSPRIIEKPYILYVGARHRHKNFDRFLESFNQVRIKHQDINLVCTWQDFTSEEKTKIHGLKLDENVIHIAATEPQMVSLYQHALCFVFPSLYEGFGMPILEAMANHCPVVLAQASCFPEIAGDAGCYFNPLSIDDMAQKIEIVINSDELRENLISKGDIRVRDFSWEKCALEHMSVYNSLI